MSVVYQIGYRIQEASSRGEGRKTAKRDVVDYAEESWRFGDHVITMRSTVRKGVHRQAKARGLKKISEKWLILTENQLQAAMNGFLTISSVDLLHLTSEQMILSSFPVLWSCRQRGNLVTFKQGLRPIWMKTLDWLKSLTLMGYTVIVALLLICKVL